MKQKVTVNGLESYRGFDIANIGFYYVYDALPDWVWFLLGESIAHS